MVLKADEVRKMNADERVVKLKELREQLMRERGVAAMGGSSPSPGKIRLLRREIARILTIQRLDEIQAMGPDGRWAPRKAARTPSRAAPPPKAAAKPSLRRAPAPKAPKAAAKRAASGKAPGAPRAAGKPAGKGVAAPSGTKPRTPTKGGRKEAGSAGRLRAAPGAAREEVTKTE